MFGFGICAHVFVLVFGVVQDERCLPMGQEKEQGVGGRKKTKSINMKTKMRTKMKTKGESMLKDIHFVKPPEEWNKYMTELNVRGGD